MILAGVGSGPVQAPDPPAQAAQTPRSRARPQPRAGTSCRTASCSTSTTRADRAAATTRVAELVDGHGAAPGRGGTLQFNLMLSLEPATARQGRLSRDLPGRRNARRSPLIDRQHPHDFLMQAAVVWRVPLARGYALTLAGAPVGEPALGPVAFMHRASASEKPTAPLAPSHVRLDAHRHGRPHRGARSRAVAGRDVGVPRTEPDEQRWDLMDPGALDSWSVRGWYRPSPALDVPDLARLPDRSRGARAGRRAADDRVGVMDAARTRAASTATTSPTDATTSPAATTTRCWPRPHTPSAATRCTDAFEAVQVETDVLRFGVHGFVGSGKARTCTEGIGGVDVGPALTLGGVRTIAPLVGMGRRCAAATSTFYARPRRARATHGDRPVSFHVFVRIRPPAPMGRMVDMMTMTQDDASKSTDR